MQYEMITAESFDAADTAKELAIKINKKLKEGWKLYGSPNTVACQKEYATKIIMSQAMKKQ